MCLDLPLPEGLDFDQRVEVQDDQFVITLRSRSSEATCPHCGQPSRSVQKCYWRRIVDLAIALKPVVLNVQARRFFCRNRSCSCHIFTEQINALARRYARCTERLRQFCVDQALMSNASEASRVSCSRGVQVSASTMLRRIRSDPTPEPEPVRILGIDEFAFRKGHTYGTVLVDQERHKIIDLLPDREPQTVVAWLKKHPQIETITRDRNGGFAAAASQGAPDAQQIADRWHLIHNLADALTKVLDGKRTVIKTVSQMENAAYKEVTTECEPVKNACENPPSGKASKAKQRQDQSHLKRQEVFDEIHRLSQLKLSGRAIARKLNLDRRTVGRYLRCDVCPDHAATGRWRKNLTEDQRRFVLERWNMGLHNITEIHRQLLETGVRVGRRTVARYLEHKAKPTTDRNITVKLSVKDVTGLIIKKPDEVTDYERTLIDDLGRADDDIKIASDLSRSFCAMLRSHSETTSSVMDWISSAKRAGLKALEDFADGLAKDISAVSKAFTQALSNGITEGVVNKIKMIKRKAYGRAKFDLLRARVLRAP